VHDNFRGSLEPLPLVRGVSAQSKQERELQQKDAQVYAVYDRNQKVLPVPKREESQIDLNQATRVNSQHLFILPLLF
jgi:hypothetical protein